MKAGADPTTKGPKGMTAEKLIAARVVKEKYSRKPNALHKALLTFESPAVIEAMLDLGFDANELNEDGYTPLYLVAEHRYVYDELIELLIEGGADVNSKNGDLKVTPLHIAALLGKSGVVSALLRHGAKVDSVDVNGSTPLYYLADHGPDSSDLVAIAKELLDHGANIDSRGLYDIAPVIVSFSDCSKMSLSKFLLDRGADIRQHRDSKGNLRSTALHYVVQCDDITNEFVDLLLSRGLDINARTSDGRTPLFEAVSDHNLHMIKFLLDRGADPNIKGVAQFPYMKTIPYAGYRHPRVTPLENARRARKYWKEEGHTSIAAYYDGVINLLSNASSSNSGGNGQGSSEEEQYGHGD